MRYTIEGFSQTEAIKFRRTEIVKDSKGNDKEKVVTLDCTDLVILRWFVDFWPSMMKVEVNGQQYGWVSYEALINDVPLIGIKKRALALKLKKLVDFNILKHHTVKNGGTYSYYGFGNEYMRLVNRPDAKIDEGSQKIDEGWSKNCTGGSQKIDEQIDSSIKDDSFTKDPIIGAKPKKSGFKPPTIEEVSAYVAEKGYHFDPEHFVDYYEAAGWVLKNGKKASNWKQCCVTWERNAKKSPQRSGQTHQRSVDFEKKATGYEEPRVGSMRYDNVTGISETYQGNGVWVQTREGDDFEDIDF